MLVEFLDMLFVENTKRIVNISDSQGRLGVKYSNSRAFMCFMYSYMLAITVEMQGSIKMLNVCL